MSDHPVPEATQPGLLLSRRERVETLVGFVALGGFVVAALAAYFAMPVADVRVATAWRAFALALLAVGLLVAVYLRTLRRISRARRPVWLAISLVVVLFVLVVLLFAYVYLSMQTRDPGQLPGLNTHLDSLYFTVTMLATVGFGDIAPVGQTARAVVTTQMVFNLFVLGFLVRTAIQAGRHERQRRASMASQTDGGARTGE